MTVSKKHDFIEFLFGVSMSDRSYEDCATELESLGFEGCIREFAILLSQVSNGQLMALRSRFIQLAYLDQNLESDERKSSNSIAEAIEEALIYNLRGNDGALDQYLIARNKEFEYIQKFGVGTPMGEILASQHSEKDEQIETTPEVNQKKGLFGWLSK